MLYVIQWFHLNLLCLYVFKVGSRYLDHLILERKYAEAASLCPKLLRGSASAWERYDGNIYFLK